MLPYPRQSFLPPHVTECVETQETWTHFNRPPSRSIYGFGFNSFGKYYTEYSRPKDETDDHTVIVYSCNEETEKLQVSLIKLIPWKGSTFLEADWPYDFVFNRWLVFEKPPALEDGSQPLILHGGCLKHLLDAPTGSIVASSFMETKDCVIELAPYKTVDRIQSVSQTKTKEQGYILMVLISTGNCDFIVDLILMHEIKLSHFKRILLKNCSELNFDPSVYIDVSLDMSSERIYLHDGDYSKGSFLYGFDFSGNQLVAQQLAIARKETFEHQTVYHLSNSVFLMYLNNVDTHIGSLKLFQINDKNEVVPLKRIN